MSAVKAVSFEGEKIFGVGAVSCTNFHDRIPGSATNFLGLLILRDNENKGL